MYWVYMYGKMSIPPISILEMTLFVVLDHVQNISLDIPVGWLEDATLCPWAVFGIVAQPCSSQRNGKNRQWTRVTLYQEDQILQDT